jgi:hypothetical protein
MTQKAFPPGWDEARARKVLAHCESQSEEEAVAEDKAAVESTADTVNDRTEAVSAGGSRLVPAVQD